MGPGTDILYLSDRCEYESRINCRIYPYLMPDISSPAGASKAPKTTRGEKTLRRLLDAAAEEFGSRGYHQASINSITPRAGVGQGTMRKRRPSTTACGPRSSVGPVGKGPPPTRVASALLIPTMRLR